MNSPALQPAVLHLVDQVREGGLLAMGCPTLVMLSGGGDSVALTAVASRICGAEHVTALHVNYGLRGEESDADEIFCREFCEKLGVALVVERIALGEDGNLHDLAREARYRLAHEAAERAGCKTIAVAHNADDRAETLLYRLAASPGRRALLGMPRRRGVILRPLLDFTRDELRAWCASESLTWREDAANLDPRFARTHVRQALALLRRVHPAAIENILRTTDELGAEAAALDAVVDGLLGGAITESGGLRVASLDAVPSPLAGLAIRAYVERAIGAPVPAARSALDRVRAASSAGGSREIDVSGARLIVEYGVLRAVGAIGSESDGLAREPITLAVPGTARFGDWRFTASAGPASDKDDEDSASTKIPRFVHLDIPASAAKDLTIRTRRPGDRMRPIGLHGSKLLQDLFVDAKLPRAERDAYPVVCADERTGEPIEDKTGKLTGERLEERAQERIVWVPGIAIGEGCARRPAAEPFVRITAERCRDPGAYTPKLPGS